MSMYGSQEGMAHIALVMCDPGDVVLVPNPGYPVFGMGPQLMGAKVETYPLYEENNFIPDFEIFRRRRPESREIYDHFLSGQSGMFRGR